MGVRGLSAIKVTLCTCENAIVKGILYDQPILFIRRGHASESGLCHLSLNLYRFLGWLIRKTLLKMLAGSWQEGSVLGSSV